MRRVRSISNWLRSLFRRNTVDQELQAELGQALKLTGIGLAIAAPISFAVGRVMANVIFGVVSADLTVMAGFTLLLIAVALVAGYFPARRALRIDPMVALRYE